MPKCCVKECDSSNQSVFGVPKERKNEWEIALNMNLNHNSKVCATHFNPQDIVTTWESGVSVSKYSICLKRPKLKLGAIPVKRLKTSHSANPTHIDAVIQNNIVHHDHNYFKLVNISTDLQSVEIQQPEILKISLTWLSKWEYNINKGYINKNEFLTKATAEGLRISLESTIDLLNYLLNECNFSYVLTSKFNQDCLEDWQDF